MAFDSKKDAEKIKHIAQHFKIIRKRLDDPKTRSEMLAKLNKVFL